MNIIQLFNELEIEFLVLGGYAVTRPKDWEDLRSQPQ